MNLVNRLKAPIDPSHNYDITTDTTLNDDINTASRGNMSCSYCAVPPGDSKDQGSKDDWYQDADGNWLYNGKDGDGKGGKKDTWDGKTDTNTKDKYASKDKSGWYKDENGKWV